MKAIQKLMAQPWVYVVILMIGIFLKFYKIDFRYFWYDEVFTIVQTSGISPKEYNEKLPVNQIKNISYYNDLLRLNKQGLSVGSQLKGQLNTPNLNPLHYAVLVFWHRIAGDSDISYRYFNVFFFLLTLPFMFYLARLLFKSDLAGWIALALFSVNGFFQYYTFEARYNTLCLFLIVLNQYVFLRAANGKGYLWWTGYVITGILSLYASIILGLVFIAHFLYVLFFERKVLIPYIAGTVIIFLGYLPWLIEIFNHIDKIFGSLSWHQSFGANQNIFTLIFAQFYFVAYSFDIINNYVAQLNFFTLHQLSGNYIAFFTNLIIIVLLIYSVIHAYKREERKNFVFILLLIIPQFLFLLVTDLVRKTGISLIPRYNILNIVGFILFLVFLFKEKITRGSYFFSGVFVLLMAISIGAGFYVANKYPYVNNAKDMKNAVLLSRSDNALLISDLKTSTAQPGSPAVLAFTNACKTDKIDILKVQPDIRNIKEYFDSTSYTDIFVLNASQKLINNLKSQFGEKMDSISLKGYTNEWQVKF